MERGGIRPALRDVMSRYAVAPYMWLTVAPRSIAVSGRLANAPRSSGRDPKACLAKIRRVRRALASIVLYIAIIAIVYGLFLELLAAFCILP